MRELGVTKDAETDRQEHAETENSRERTRQQRLASPEEADHNEGKRQTYTKRWMERDTPLCHLGSLSTVIGLSLISWAQLRLPWL